MSGGDLRGHFLHSLPSKVLWEFCRVMDGLSDLDWTRFASEVLVDQTTVRLAERKDRRTDCVMNHWGNRNGRVGELIDLLERLELFRPRDVILGYWSNYKPLSSLPPPPPPVLPAPRPPQDSLSRFDPAPKVSDAPLTLSTRRLSPTEDKGGGGKQLPRPAPPPSSLLSDHHLPIKTPALAPCSGVVRVMSWSYEEIYAATNGFSPSLQVGEGGFGIVYRATLSNVDCAVKRLKEDCVLNWTLLKETFHTEAEKLSRFRHPNIVDLLGVSEGGGSVCLIYSYMENKSLEDQLHNENVTLSWSHRLSIVEGVASALSFLHSPPDRNAPLIHGDVKSANILLDTHLVAKLADFGLARSASCASSVRPGARTMTFGKTETVRGTLAYLPDEYVRNGELGTAVDVYSFGVVLLEIVTGRLALDREGKSGCRYLKDLVEEVANSPTGSCEAAWRKELDCRLITGGAADPAGWMNIVSLACSCLEERKKKRPNMEEVLKKLKDLHAKLRVTSSSPPSSLIHPFSQSVPCPPSFTTSSVGALSDQLSKLRPLKDTNHPSQFSTSSSSSSSSSSCTPALPHPLHSSSFIGPCESDESQGFSQYDIYSHCRSNGSSSRSQSLTTRDQYHCPNEPSESQVSEPSVPVEDQYNFPHQPSTSRDRSGIGTLTDSDTSGQTAGATARLYSVPEWLSPAGSLQSSSPRASVHKSPSKQSFSEKKSHDEEGRNQTVEHLASSDLYGSRSAGSRGPEECDELDNQPDKHN